MACSGSFGQRLQRAFYRLLTGPRAPLDNGSGRGRRAAVPHQCATDGRQRARGHKDDQCSVELSQRRPVYRTGFSFRIFVAGNEDGGRSCAAMGEGNARIGVAPEAADMPGTISKLTPACFKCRASSPPRPNTRGSPPLRRTTVSPSRARFYHEFVDRLLSITGASPPFADVDWFAGGRDQVEQAAVEKFVVEYDVGFA